ncbi:MAG: hypothetical protein JXR97_08850 [Planctomycetes bacterium]|nr:hypothetical protein [Planctomycetota bacterium]
MREVPVNMLKPIAKLPVAVLHKSGIIILQANEELNDDVIATISDSGTDMVYFAEAGERIDELRRELTHVALPLTDLTPGESLTRSLYDNSGQLLLEEGTAIPSNFAASLQRRGMDTIYFRKPPEQIEPAVARSLRADIEKVHKGESDVAPKEVIEQLEKIELKMADADDLDAAKLEAKINGLDKIEIKPGKDPFEKQIKTAKERGPATEKEKRNFTNAIEESLADIKTIYTTLADGGGRSILPLIDKVATRALAGLIQNRELLMLCGTTDSPEEYLATHSLAMTVISVNIGTCLSYDAAQIKSLAYGAMLSDVGMLKVPKEIVSKNEKLSPSEYAEIKRHSAYGLDLLQSISSIPEEVPYVVYQSHERANGSGYPCGKKDVVVHPFARIVGASDIYTSVCAKRPYRDAKLPYEAMEQLVLMCGKRLLNPNIIKAFLKCNSMFPVGSFVRLSDGSGARVVAANPEDYMRPMLSLLTDTDNNSLTEPERLDLLENKDITVTQAIYRNDMAIPDDPMIGF